MDVVNFLMSSCAVLFGIPFLLICFLSVRWVLQAIYQNSKYKLPPGPVGLPILGCLPKVDTGEPLHYILTDMAAAYGDMFSMRLGDKLTVVISSVKAMKETIILQGRKFAGRPRFATFKETKGGFDKGISLRDMSVEYKENRKLVYHGFKNLFSLNGQLHSILPDECNKLINYLKKKGAEPFNPIPIFRKASASVFLRVTFGDNYDYDDKELVTFISVMEEWFEMAESNNPGDFITLLECLPSERLKKAKQITDNFDDFCKQHLLNKWAGKSESMGYFSSSFVDEMKDLSARLAESEQEVDEMEMIESLASRYASTITDMIGGGFDTVPNTLGWMMLFLHQNPDAVQNLSAEARRNADVDIKDFLRTDLYPYLIASIHEAVRQSVVAPLALPHSTMQDVAVRDFVLPKDTLVFLNLWEINHSEDLWDEPNIFDPSRFLINNNEFDIRKTRSVYSFSSGVRRCPGEKFAIFQMQAFVGSIIKHFNFKVVNPPEDMHPMKGLTSKPKPYDIVLEYKE